MNESIDLVDQELVRIRLNEIIKNSGLTPLGFSYLMGITLNHVYALINGNRRLSKKFIETLTMLYEFEAKNILINNYTSPQNIDQLTEIINFSVKYRDNNEFFNSTWTLMKRSKIVEDLIFKHDLLIKPLYLRQIREKINSLVHFPYASDELSKILNYLITQGKIVKSKGRILKMDGTEGKRIVDIFSKIS